MVLLGWASFNYSQSKTNKQHNMVHPDTTIIKHHTGIMNHQSQAVEACVQSCLLQTFSKTYLKTQGTSVLVCVGVSNQSNSIRATLSWMCLDRPGPAGHCTWLQQREIIYNNTWHWHSTFHPGCGNIFFFLLLCDNQICSCWDPLSCSRIC